MILIFAVGLEIIKFNYTSNVLSNIVWDKFSGWIQVYVATHPKAPYELSQ